MLGTPDRSPDPLFLKMEQRGGAVDFRLVDRSGNRVPGGLIFSINEVGRLVIHPKVPEDLAERAGLLTEEGMLAVVSYL